MLHQKLVYFYYNVLLFPQRFRSDFNIENYHLASHYPIVCFVNLLSGSHVPDEKKRYNLGETGVPTLKLFYPV